MDTQTARAVMVQAIAAIAGDDGDPERLPAGTHSEIHCTAEARVDGVNTHLSFSGYADVFNRTKRRQAVSVDPVHVAAWLLAKIPKAKRDKLLASLPKSAEPPEEYAAAARRIVDLFRRRERVPHPPTLTVRLEPTHKPRK